MIHGMTLCLHRGSTPTRNPSANANDVVLTIRIRDGVHRSRRKSSIDRSAAGRLPSLAQAASLLLLLEQLNQWNESHRRQSHALLQSLEQAGKAALGNDLAGALQVGPDRMAGKARPSEDRQRGRTQGAKALCEGCLYLEGGQVARDRDWHVQRISKELG